MRNMPNHGRLLYTIAVPMDYATDRQAEALKWFNRICGENGWVKNTRMTVTGHSEGDKWGIFYVANNI